MRVLGTISGSASSCSAAGKGLLGLIHFISQIISGSGPIFPAWLNLGRIMVPQEREEYEYSKKGEGEGNTIDKLGTSTKERTQGASSPSSASNYARPGPLLRSLRLWTIPSEAAR